MGLVSNIAAGTRLVAGLRRAVRTHLSLEEARTLIRRRLDERPRRFLSLVERGVFGYPASPYLPLFNAAGCGYGDLVQMVHAHGLDSTLTQLRAAGVYVTFEEFKGREPLVRHGRSYQVTTTDFLNPLHRPSVWKQSSGSTGTPTPSSVDLGGVALGAAHHLVGHDALGLTGAPLALWRGLLPAGAGLAFVLNAVAAGNAPRRWFTPVAPRDLTSSRKFPLTNYAILALARAHGARVPWPEHVPFDRAVVVAQWAADTVRTEGRCYLALQASAALRMCLAAREAGLDLTGTTISGGGEPMTPAKARPITEAGVRIRQNYASSETGAMGKACGSPCEDGDVHLLDDAVVVNTAKRVVPGTEFDVDAFHVTSLLPTSSYLLLNVGLDDYGVIEDRPCGCSLGTLGLTRHARGIQSFRKLTGEGVSLVGSDMVRILSEVLPARFGGTPLDYQLVEDEDADGFSRLSIAISPHVAIENNTDVVETVMSALANTGAGPDHARALWQQARSMRIIRKEPTWTASGKFLPLYRPKRYAGAQTEATRRQSPNGQATL